MKSGPRFNPDRVLHLSRSARLFQAELSALSSDWFWASYPRLRADPLQRLCWLVLVPASLAQLVLTVTVRMAL